MNEIEIWKPIKGFALYQVSSFGAVRSISRIRYSNLHPEGNLIRGKVLSPNKNVRSGYLSVTLCNGKTKQRLYIHRLVALAFLPNPYNLPEVNHKDENKSNNRLENLEWCSVLYNKHYGTGQQRRLLSARLNKRGRCYPKKVLQFSLDGEYINSYNSSEDAARAIGHPKGGGQIRRCARGYSGTLQAYGYKWSYENQP